MSAESELVGDFRHGSNETADYSIDWSRQLAADSDTISASTWVAESGTPTIGDGGNGAIGPTHAGGVASLWIVGGTVGDVYLLSNRVETAGGRTLEGSLRITVVDK